MAKKSGDETLDRMYDIVNGPDDNVIDPIAYRSDYRPEDINPKYTGDPNIPGVGPQGANEHFNEYGDDSNTQWQSVKGGRNEKYTGEGVKTSELDYDPNVTTAGLDPNYTFGNEVKTSKTKESGYLAKRNDMIASALYNEGKVSREDVANYLSAQKGWFNSTEADRQNTIEAIWKRIGQMSPKEEQKQEGQEGDYGIIKDNSGTIYGKTSAEEGNPKEGINTLSDANSPYTIMEESRVANLNELASMSNENIAMSLNEGINPANLQALRDFQSQFPERWAEVQQYQKKLKAQNTVTSIANGTEIDTDNNGQSVVNNSIADFANSNAGAVKTSQEITKDVNNALAENQTANQASETMASIEEDMAILKNRLKNLRNEANSKFKGDVPDYLVNAYVANKSQEIQNQMSILEDRYNAAYNRYKTEVANTQWEKEYELKKEELQLKKDSLALDKYKVEQGLSTTTSTSTSSTAATNEGDSYQVTTLSDEKVGEAVDQLVEDIRAGKVGNSQCAAGIQTYYLPKLGITLPNLSSWENKQKLINEGPDYTPKKGDLMIMSSQTAPKYGHIAIVTGVDENGNITYIDWNGSVDADGKGTEKAQERMINADSKTIKGFRNINKGQGQASTSSETTETTDTTQYTDGEYSAFQKYLSSEISANEKKQLEGQYGFTGNPAGMTAFVRNALANRNSTATPDTESSTTGQTTDDKGRVVVTDKDGNQVTYAYGVSADDARLNEPGFDPVLGYNPNLRGTYKQILLDNGESKESGAWLSNRAEFTKRKEGQLWEEANNFKEAEKSGYDAYSDPNRKVSRDFGFAIEKKDVYDNFNQLRAKGKPTDVDWRHFIEELGLNPDDPKAKSKASDELAKFNEWSTNELNDESTNRLVEALEFMIMQDATLWQRKRIMSNGTDENGNVKIDGLSGEAADWAIAYNMVLATEVFDKLINTKGAGATLYPVSDADMRMIKNASTLINGWSTSDAFKRDVNAKYKAIRQYIGKPISDEDLEQMWNQEGSIPISAWTNPLTGTKYSGDFHNYLIIDHAHKTGIFGGYNYGGKGNKSTTATTTETNTTKPQNNYSTTQGTGDYTSQIMG